MDVPANLPLDRTLFVGGSSKDSRRYIALPNEIYVCRDAETAQAVKQNAKQDWPSFSVISFDDGCDIAIRLATASNSQPNLLVLVTPNATNNTELFELAKKFRGNSLVINFSMDGKIKAIGYEFYSYLSRGTSFQKICRRFESIGHREDLHRPLRVERLLETISLFLAGTRKDIP
jgi:hypothetical protein